MNSGANMLDLFLAPPANGQQPGSSLIGVSKEAANTVFAGLIESLLTVPTSEDLIMPAEIPVVDDTFEENPSLLNNGNQTTIDNEAPIPGNIPILDQPDKSSSDTSKMPAENDLKLPANMPMTNDSLRCLLQQEPAAISEGKFVVHSESVSNGMLHLQVSPVPATSDSVAGEKPVPDFNVPVTTTDKPTIKISIPVSTIDTQTATPDRVPLGVGTNESNRFSHLLSELNVKQIEISHPEQVETSISQPKIVTLKLTGEVSGQAVQIVSQLPTNRMMATTTRKQDPTATMTDSESELLADNPDGTKRTVLHAKPRPDGSAISGPQSKLTGEKQNNSSELIFGKTFTQQDSTLRELPFDTGFRPIITESSTMSQRPVARPVLFDLPDQLNQTLKPNGQAIMIRINPDHLGPARLSLRLRNDILSARLLVDSPEAKLLIEGSLDRLTQQLEKADIKVNQIEVIVSGDELQDHDSERKPVWARRPRMNNKKFDMQMLEDQGTPLVPQAFENNYVHSSGVNVLA